jgi:hypothetical protein
VWGLVWILSAVGSLLQLASLLLTPAPPGGTASYLKTALVSAAMTGVVGPLILIFGSARIASWLFPAEEKIVPDQAARSLLPVLLAVVGVSFSLYALPSLAGIGLPGSPSRMYRAAPVKGSGSLGAALQFVAGIALFLGSGPLGKLWRRLNPEEGAD